MVVAVGGAAALFVRAGSLAADAHERDDRVSVHAFRLIFDGMGVVILVTAAVAAFAVWALWQGHRWAWCFQVVLSILGSLSVINPRSVWVAVSSLPAVVASVALFMPAARAYVRRDRAVVDGG